MTDEPIDFDTMFPDFNPSEFEETYPSKNDFPDPYWEIATRKVYDHELYSMARNTAYDDKFRQLARDAWAVIELNTADEYVCELAERLLDCAFGRDDSLTLEPLNVSVYLSVMLWAGFREPGKSDWVQHVLHETIGLIDDLENPALSVEQAFAAGWAAGRVAGEMESR
tara:strand:+ start:638 stop:1141 length:504 start_codon:yes stop_codon:yes gene_type:complete